MLIFLIFVVKISVTNIEAKGDTLVELRELAENGSPRAVFETTDDRLTFLVTIPIHNDCTESSETSSETSSGTRHKTSNRILELIKSDSKITAPQIAMELGISTRGVEKNLRLLRESGVLKRIGSPTYGGYWEIVTKTSL